MPVRVKKTRGGKTNGNEPAWNRVPLLLRAVKQHPHGKILRNILETMGNMRGTEQHVARTNWGYRFLDSIMAASGGDEIEFIALMRDLRSVGGAGGESDLKITVNEHFGRSPWCPWQSERGGERHWRRRAIHGSPSRQGKKIAHHTAISN
jgi:hypothetical protein